MAHGSWYTFLINCVFLGQSTKIDYLHFLNKNYIIDIVVNLQNVFFMAFVE